MNAVTFEAKCFSRRALFGAAACLLLLSACEARPKTVVLDVVLFSYLAQPIFDVFIDGKAGESSGNTPGGGGSTIIGVSLTLGPKKVVWTLDGPEGTPRSGETVSNKNPLQLTELVPGAQYLGIHIYQDETVELVTSAGFPQRTERGKRELAKLKGKTAQIVVPEALP